MFVQRSFCACSLANPRGRELVLYVGVTSDLARRLAQHRTRPSGFVERYRLTTLVLVETFSTPSAAIAREKQLKGWTRAKKLALVSKRNPGLRNLDVVVLTESREDPDVLR